MTTNMKKLLMGVLIGLLSLALPGGVAAATGEVLGIHILNPYELEDAKALLELETLSSDEWHYVTIPLSLNDLGKQKEWQSFFDLARERQVVPLVRLATKDENGRWKKPTREEVVQLLDFANTLRWPTDERYVIVFNEVNHAKEWGGTIDPEEYAEVLRFASVWADAQHNSFVILPAAMDLAAPNSRETMEAFTYLNRMHAHDPDIFTLVDFWNSHSYPNPGFSASPYRSGQNSLRGFEYELAYLKRKTSQDYQVFITETGWAENPSTARLLESYYTYALKNIWSDPRIVAVTPFLLRGDPGPFKVFTFLDSQSQPTLQYQALRRALENIRSASTTASATASAVATPSATATPSAAQP